MAKNRRQLFKRSKSLASQPAGSTDANFLEEQPRGTKPPDRSATLNRLALLFLILSAVVLAWYLIIFFIPGFPFNPLPPYSLALDTVAPTPTPQPTSTPTNTPTPMATPTSTPRPSWTPAPTDTPQRAAVVTGTRRAGTRTPTFTPTPTETPTPGPTKSPFNYTAEVMYQRAQLYGVNWSGLAGLVFGLDLKHQPGMTIKVWGDPPIGQVGAAFITGTSPQYGPSGWEVTLGDRPVSGKWSVQLVDVNGNALSPVVDVELKGDPRANLAYIIFQQNH